MSDLNLRAAALELAIRKLTPEERIKVLHNALEDEWNSAIRASIALISKPRAAERTPDA